MSWAIKFLVTLLQIHSSFADYKVETINISLMHPDTPVYDARTGFLYFADEDRLYSYDRANNTHSWIDVAGQLGPIVPTKVNTSDIIVGVDNELVKITWDGIGTIKARESYSRVGTNETTYYNKTTLYNSGRADTSGRLWFATLDSLKGVPLKNQGSLINITKENKNNPSTYNSHFWTKICGFAFTKNNEIVYYANPATQQIIKNNFNVKTGTLTKPGVSFDLLKQKGKTWSNVEITGVATDTNNNIWASVLHPGIIFKIDANSGKILKEITVPASYVTNIGWGGNNMDTLYVTAYTQTIYENFRNNTGKLLAVTGLGDKGIKTFEADIS